MAEITITIPDAQVQRVRDAFTFALELDEPAQVSDVQAYIVADLKQFVRTAEKRQARKIAELTVTDVDFS